MSPDDSCPQLGLALGGGSVFGYAHVGVLEVLDASGLRPDLLAGTSAGAIAASLYAFGIPLDTVRERFGAMTWRQITGVAPGRLGLFENAPLGDLMDELLGPVRIEDAPIPLAITATDIESGTRVVLREGPVADAVRASACTPGLYTPVEIDGRRLVDGGLLDNVPVGRLRDADVVVGVSLMADAPFSRVRTLHQVLVNAASFALRETTRLELEAAADVVIQPDLSGRASWSLADLPGVLEAGRLAAEAQLPLVREALGRAARDGADPAVSFAQSLVSHVCASATPVPLRAGPVRCTGKGYCALTVESAGRPRVLYSLSVWGEADHLLVRVESSTVEEHVRVPLTRGRIRAEDWAEGERAIRDLIEMDLQRILTAGP